MYDTDRENALRTAYSQVSLYAGIAALRALSGTRGRGTGTSKVPFIDALALQLRPHRDLTPQECGQRQEDFPGKAGSASPHREQERASPQHPHRRGANSTHASSPANYSHILIMTADFASAAAPPAPAPPAPPTRSTNSLKWGGAHLKSPSTYLKSFWAPRPAAASTPTAVPPAPPPPPPPLVCGWFWPLHLCCVRTASVSVLFMLCRSSACVCVCVCVCMCTCRY